MSGYTQITTPTIIYSGIETNFSYTTILIFIALIVLFVIFISLTIALIPQPRVVNIPLNGSLLSILPGTIGTKNRLDTDSQFEK